MPRQRNTATSSADARVDIENNNTRRIAFIASLTRMLRHGKEPQLRSAAGSRARIRGIQPIRQGRDYYRRTRFGKAANRCDPVRNSMVTDSYEMVSGSALAVRRRFGVE